MLGSLDDGRAAEYSSLIAAALAPPQRLSVTFGARNSIWGAESFVCVAGAQPRHVEATENTHSGFRRSGIGAMTPTIPAWQCALRSASRMTRHCGLLFESVVVTYRISCPRCGVAMLVATPPVLAGTWGAQRA